MSAGQLGGAALALAHDPHSLLAQEAGGDGHTLTEHLLYMVLDELRLANWQRSKDGQKNRRRPKRISPLAQKPGTQYGEVPEEREPGEVAAMLARYGPQPRAAPPADSAEVEVSAPVDLDGGGAADGTVGGFEAAPPTP